MRWTNLKLLDIAICNYSQIAYSLKYINEWLWMTIDSVVCSSLGIQLFWKPMAPIYNMYVVYKKNGYTICANVIWIIWYFLQLCRIIVSLATWWFWIQCRIYLHHYVRVKITIVYTHLHLTKCSSHYEKWWKIRKC